MTVIPSERDVREWTPEEQREALLYGYNRQFGPYGMALRIVTVANPSAGADFTITLAGQLTQNVVWIPMSLSATLTASATAANRVPRITLTTGGNTVMIGPSSAVVTASQVGNIAWMRGGAFANANSNALGSVLAQCAIPPGATIQSVTSNVQSGDQWSAIALYVLEISQRPPEVILEQVGEIMAGSPAFENYPAAWLGL